MEAALAIQRERKIGMIRAAVCSIIVLILPLNIASIVIGSTFSMIAQCQTSAMGLDTWLIAEGAVHMCIILPLLCLGIGFMTDIPLLSIPAVFVIFGMGLWNMAWFGLGIYLLVKTPECVDVAPVLYIYSIVMVVITGLSILQGCLTKNK